MNGLNVNIDSLKKILVINSGNVPVMIQKTVSIEAGNKTIVNYILWGEGNNWPHPGDIYKADKDLRPAVMFEVTRKSDFEIQVCYFH